MSDIQLTLRPVSPTPDLDLAGTQQGEISLTLREFYQGEKGEKGEKGESGLAANLAMEPDPTIGLESDNLPDAVRELAQDVNEISAIDLRIQWLIKLGEQ